MRRDEIRIPVPWADRLGPEAECAGLTSWSLRLQRGGRLAWQGVGAVGSPGPVSEQGLRVCPKVRCDPRMGGIFPQVGGLCLL